MSLRGVLGNAVDTANAMNGIILAEKTKGSDFLYYETNGRIS